MSFFHLEINPAMIPRTTTREQWREIDRWRRVSEQKITGEINSRAENAMIYGTSHPEIYQHPMSDE